DDDDHHHPHIFDERQRSLAIYRHYWWQFPMRNHKLGTLTKDPPHPEQRQRQCFDLCERNSILDYDVENSKKLTGSAKII
ncbi:protein REGULATOR OF AXILLARY MERISTEMS 2, partial [Trichinella spiralis]|uniref:protein REGULATOR OF AXILLARY MERISTEMS 2 n=1 Tax=Trichinella spiralis TaxID=6334 RepID=UPI0001EFED70